MYLPNRTFGKYNSISSITKFRELTVMMGVLVGIFMLAGCQTASQGLTKSDVASVDIKMKKDGQKILTKFQRRAEPGMSKRDVKRLMASIEESWYDDGSPGNRAFEMEEDTKIETWEYDLYGKFLVLTFKNGKLSKMDTRKGEAYLEQEY